MKNMFYFAAILILLPVAYSVTNLSQNETYPYNYTNSTNQSATEVFFCAAHNESMCMAKNISLSLNPGDTLTTLNGTCSVTASCAAGSGGNATCVIDRTLAPGETFRSTSGTCDVKVVATGGNTSTTTTVPQRQTVSIRKDGDTIHLVVGNRTFDIPVTSNSFSYDQVVELQCPAAPTFQESDDVDYLVKQCRSWVPMLDETISTLVVNTRTCSESAKTHVDDVKLCGDRERAQLTQIGTMEGQLAQANKDVEAAREAEGRARDAEVLAAKKAVTYKVLMWLFVVVWVITLGALIAMGLSTKIKQVPK